MIVKEILSDTDSIYNYMNDELVLGYLEIRLVDGVVDIMNLFVNELVKRIILELCLKLMKIIIQQLDYTINLDLKRLV